MDPVFNSTDTHTNPHQPIPDFNSLGFGSHPHTLGSSTSWIEQQQSHSQHQPNMPISSASATENANGSIPSLLPSSSSSLTADPILRNALPSAINFGNGNVPDAINGTNGVMMNKDSSSIAAADSASATPPKTHVYPLPTNLPNNVDLQALLTKLSPSITQQTVSPQSPQVTSSTIPAATTTVTAPAHVSSPSQARVPSLPKPPAQAQVPNQPPIQNHQTTHPLPQPPATSAVNGTSGHSGHPAGYPASLPPPPNFNQHRQQVPDSPTGTEENEEDNRPFTAEEEEAYDRFLSDERDYVTQGQWDRFPAGSRLFIGNLPTEKVTKRDLFRTFHKHGRLAQVSIKQAYGFVQFLDTASCASALRFEQGASVRGRKMHLEVSKPQRNTRPPPSDSNPSRGANRRSRSPDYGRSMSPRGRGGSTFRGGRNSGDFTDRGFTRGARDTRDHEYPSRRSSPPPRYRARDDYRPHHRDRSRSPPPGRYRQRTRSPPVVEELPRRDPKEVPEVQALVMDEVDRNFIWWIEKSFRDRGLSFDSVFLNPRIPLEPLVKQQILEGVQAIVFLSRQMQASSKISIQVFDRRGDGEATYDQYDDLDPSIAAEIVYRAKLAHAPQPPMQVPTYGGYGIPQQQQQQQQPQQPQQQQSMLQQTAIPNLANVLGALDPATLKTLLANLQQQQQPQQPQIQPQIHQQHQHHHQQQHMLQAQPQLGQDLAALLSLPMQQPQQNHSLNSNTNPYGVQTNPGYGANAGLAALLGQVQQGNVQVPQQGQTPAQMQAIMDELVRWQPNKSQN